jgi:hypothetical protein
VNPSFTVDANGNTWVAYVEEDTRVGVTAGIVVYRRAAGKSNWVAAGYQQPFSDVGPYDTMYRAKRSARLVTIPGGIGMVYTVGKDIFWAERQLKGGATWPGTARRCSWRHRRQRPHVQPLQRGHRRTATSSSPSPMRAACTSPAGMPRPASGPASPGC